MEFVKAKPAPEPSASVPADDSDAEPESVDPSQRAAVSQEILSSAFVASMFAVPSSDDEEYVMVEPVSTTRPPVSELTMLQVLEGIVDGKLSVNIPVSVWKSFDASDTLGVCDSRPSPLPTSPPPSLPLDDLCVNGYAVCEPNAAFGSRVCPALVSAIRSLTAAGWPPIFAFVFDELWQYVAQYVQPIMASVLGSSCVCVPSPPCPV